MTARCFPECAALLTALLVLAPWPGQGAGLVEEFDSDPAGRGWNRFGDASLFQWNPAGLSLEVTWDSSKSNSYFFRRLSTILAKNDNFAMQFDLQLDSIQAGANPEKPSTFQIAVGFLNLEAATRASFSRGTGHDSPNLVEFNYFPAADFIADTVSTVLVSSNSQFAAGFAYPLELTTGHVFHIAMAYTASNHTLVTTMTRDGSGFGLIPAVTLGASFTDFHLDAVAIASYNDSGDSMGSILARGRIDNLAVTLPLPPVTELSASVTEGGAQVQFMARTNWIYALERTLDFARWQSLWPSQTGIAGRLVFTDDQAATSTGGLYRVRAHRP